MPTTSKKSSAPQSQARNAQLVSRYLELPAVAKTAIESNPKLSASLKEHLAARLIPRELSASDISLLREAISVQRYVAPVRQGKPALIGSSSLLRTMLEDSMSLIQSFCVSVGRIEISAPGRSDGERPFGTGWMFEPGRIMTNRHVAELLIRSSDIANSRIDFGEELGNDTNQFQINLSGYLERAEFPDYAILELESGVGMPPPLPLAAQQPLPLNLPVYTIGYPDDVLENPTKSVKVFTAGTINQAPAHDGTSDLGVRGFAFEATYGNDFGLSGSPIFAFDTNRVVGVHYARGDSGWARAYTLSSIIADLQLRRSEPQASMLSRDATDDILQLSLQEIVNRALRGDDQSLKEARKILRRIRKA